MSAVSSGGLEAAPSHSVQFYDDDTFLLASLVRFAGEALAAGHAVVIFATGPHVVELDRRLRGAGVDLAAAAANGRYLALDAEQALSRIMVGDHPGEAAFAETVESVVARAAARHGHVCAFGEIVALLCGQGRHDAALRIEQFWNLLATRQPLSLLCAYPLTCFRHGVPGERFGEICAAHGQVAPTEDYLHLAEHERSRFVASLQRRAHVLEHEVALREELQNKLAAREHELSDFLENGAEALHKVGADGTILWANKAELTLLGYTASEYVGHNIAEFHVDPELAHECVRRLRSGESLRDVPAQLIRKDRSIRHVLISSNAFRVNGEFAYTRCFSRDVTGTVQAGQRLREELDAWEVLQRTGEALGGELDIVRLLQTITDAAVELTHAAFGAYLRAGGKADRESFEPLVLTGVTRETFNDWEWPRDAAFPHAGDPCVVRCEDLRGPASDSGDPPDATQTRRRPVGSGLVIRVVLRSGEAHGAIFLGHPEAGVFSRRDELIASGIASHAATAIDNARLFRAGQRAREEQRQLNETLEERIAERTEALRRSELQLHRLISGIKEYAVFLLDADGNVLTWNPGAQRIKGYSSEEIIGRSFASFYTPEDRAAGLPAKALAAARANGKYEAEAWRVRKDGSRFWANVLLDAVHDDDGRIVGFAKVTRDMTERRAIEDHLRQAQKMEAVGRLTGGVAHDFNNLLTIIIGNLDSICREPSADARMRSAAAHAMHGAQRAATLTRQLLAFSRQQPLEPKPTDINRLVAATAELLARTFGQAFAVMTALADAVWTSEVDAAQLESAIINLAMNARDAMPDGGTLTIGTANVHRERAPAGDPRWVGGDYVTISIADTGTGMDARVLEQAFEPFFTTKPAGQGTGLGLSQVYGFVKQSGGHVDIASEPGGGTTVTISLPRLVAAAIERDDADANGGPDMPLTGRGTILLVEDNDDIRRHTSEMLRELGYTVVVAADGPQALRQIESQPGIDLLFTDVGLPGMNGIALAEHVHRRDAGIRILFTTGYAGEAVAQLGRPDSRGGLLKKPYTRIELARRVSVLLGAPARDAAPRVLVVEDNTALRDLTARMLEELGFRVRAVAGVAAACALIDGAARFDVALIDVRLADGTGRDVVAALRASGQSPPILLTSGAHEDLECDGMRLHALRKPYGFGALAAALDECGVSARSAAPAAPPDSAAAVAPGDVTPGRP